MENSNIFFISHKSEDDSLVSELYDILLEIRRELEGKIYFDHRPDLPLEKAESWCPSILKEVDNSKYLIFIASDPKYLREGGGWLYEEVAQFQKRKASRHVNNRSELNVSYFGILLCDCDFESELFNDPKLGSEYRKLYQSPEHLFLGKGATLADAKERIKNKILSLLSDNTINENAALILDRARAFAAEKSHNDYTFTPSEIDERLVPDIENSAQIQDSDHNKGKSERRMDFSELCNHVQSKHVSLLGYEGGCGKTTLLTKLFYEFLEKADPSNHSSLIPLYIDAKGLEGENHLILRHLSKFFFGEYTATTDKTTSENAGILDHEFSLKTTSPRYLLIIDGYNEIPERVLPKFKREMLEFLPGGRYSNVRVVISGRHIDIELPEDYFEKFRVKPLSDNKIKKYLADSGLWTENIGESMLKILKLPMYLKIYAQTASSESIGNKSELLNAFIKRQLDKDSNSAEAEATKSLYSLFLTHILPIVAHRMITGNTLLSSEEFEDTLAYASKLLTESSYKRTYGEEYRKNLRASDFSSYDELDLADISGNYFTRVCKMLRTDKYGKLDFVHQIYRDFFCAKFISEQMKYSVTADAFADSLSKKIFDKEIISFTSELLRERAPFVDSNGCWDYSCNTDSVAISLINKLKGCSDHDSAVSVANIIEILKSARCGDLSGLDLSKLNLTKSALATCIFYRFDKESAYPTSFSQSAIDCHNIFTEKHFDEILAVCTNEKKVACIDLNGVIKLWDKQSNALFPEKIIYDMRYSVKKMLFSEDNQAIFAMTDHEILEIAIPEEFTSTAEPSCIFNTPSHLADIRLDNSGRLMFSTILNPFNYKYTDEPNSPDKHKFLCINSAACILPGEKRIAFGHLVGYEALKIYDYSEEKDLWVERKFGYSKILNDYIAELEEFFKNIKLYHLFATDNKFRDERRTFFVYLQQQFEDSTHDHHRIPLKIANRCISSLEKNKEKPTKLYKWQQTMLDAIVEKYRNILYKAEKENPLLMLLAGRKITGISTGQDSNVILISAAIDYEERFKEQHTHRKAEKEADKSRRFNNMVIELDTETFETRYVMSFIANTRLYASYCGDDIVIRSKYHVTVFDKNMNDVCHVTTCPKSLNNLVPDTSGESFYILCSHFIYKMDKNMKCIKSINNSFGKANLCIIKDPDGREFFVQKSSLRKNDSGKPIRAIDLTNGAECKLEALEPSNFTTSSPLKSITLNETSFKSCSEKLVKFYNEIKCNEYEIPYKMFVCGCDFTGVSGSVSDPRYIRMLSSMGAITDEPDIAPIDVTAAPIEDFVRSCESFIIPDFEEERHLSPYVFNESTSLNEDCPDDNADTSKDYNLFFQKGWNRINRDTFYLGCLEQTDFSILEWLNTFGVCTTDMITNLVHSGILPMPQKYSHIERRLPGALHKTYKFAFKSKFYDSEGNFSIPIFSVYFPFGAKLLEYITGNMPKNLLLTDETKASLFQNRIPGREHDKMVLNNQKVLEDICSKLALNNWFALTARRYKDILRDYSLRSIFDTDNHFSGRANVHGYLQLGDRPIFAQAFRKCNRERALADAKDKILRLSLLSVYYPSLIRYDKRLNKLKRQPVIVVIGEDFEHCKLINSMIEGVYPNVRKLFTFDSLLMSEEAFEGAGNYFEFTYNTPHSVRLEDVL